MVGLRGIIDLIHKLDERLAAGREHDDSWRETDRLLSDILRDLKQQSAREQLLTGSVTELSHTYSQLVREISLLSSVSQLLESRTTPDELFDQLPELLRREFRADSASIMLIDEESETLEIVGSSLIEDIPGAVGVSIPVGEGVAGWVARYRRPWLVRDTTHDRQYQVYAAARVNPRSLLVVPVMRQEHIFGVINLGSETAEYFTQRQEQLLTVVASLLAITIGSARLYQELESRIQLQNRELVEVRDFLENVIHISDDVIIVFDCYQKILLISPSVEKVFGYKPEELIGNHVTALLTDGGAFSRMVKMLEEEEVLRDLDMIVPHQAGQDIPTAMTVSRMTQADGKIIGYLATIRNIERRAQLYRELSRANERLRALFAASQKISSTLKINEVLGSIVQSTLTLLDADSAMLLLFNHQTGVLEPIVQAGQQSSEVTPAVDSPLGIVARQGKALLLEDSRTVRQFFPEIDPRVKSKIVIPLTAREHVLGVLDIDSLREERVFTPDDRNLANSFAQQASLAVENARLYGTTHIERRRFQELLALSRQITTGMKLEEVMSLYTDHIIQQTGALACRIYQSQSDGFSLVAQNESVTAEPIPEFDISQQELTSCLEQGKPWLIKEKDRESGYHVTCFPIGQPEPGDQFGVLVVTATSPLLEPGDAEFLQVLILQLISLMNDIRLNAEVTKTKNYLEDLIASSSDAIVSTDRAGHVTLFSRGAQEMLGYTADEIIGRPVARLIVDSDKLLKFLRGYLNKKKTPPPSELQLIRSDASNF